MECPKCEKDTFDGQHCMCGYVEQSVPQIKKIYHLICDWCKEPVVIYEWYGALPGEHEYKKKKVILCPECYSKRSNLMTSQESRDDWARKNGELTMSPARLKQYRNFQDWCEGKI